MSQLAPPVNTTARNIGLLVIRGYLILVAILVVVRFGQTLLGQAH